MAKKRKTGDPLVRVYVPALAQVLAEAERAKGSALTAAEVASFREKAIFVMIPKSGALELVQGRGFHDINPDRAAEEWPAVRDKFSLD
jgi:hypothetical protein